MGHVLGLDHEDRRCALMNFHMRDRAPYPCPQPAPGSTSWWRSPLRADDVRGLRRLWSRPASQPPVADFSTGLMGEVHRAGEDLRFIDTSRDDQGVVSMRWDFGDPASGGANTARTHGVAHHTYAAPGTYTVTLRVVDFHGYADTAQKTVVVEAPAPEPTPEPE